MKEKERVHSFLLIEISQGKLLIIDGKAKSKLPYKRKFVLFKFLLSLWQERETHCPFCNFHLGKCLLFSLDKVLGSAVSTMR